MSNTYFAEDGTYGSAHNLVTVDTSKWTEDDWDEIEETNDWERPAVAVTITINRNAKEAK